jgi:hypothetical protein
MRAALTGATAVRPDAWGSRVRPRRVAKLWSGLIWARAKPAIKPHQSFGTLHAPNPLGLAVIAREFADVLIVAKPPPLVQKIVFGALAPIGRVLGYRAIHPEYSPAEIARSRPNSSQRDRTP